MKALLGKKYNSVTSRLASRSKKSRQTRRNNHRRANSSDSSSTSSTSDSDTGSSYSTHSTHHSSKETIFMNHLNQYFPRSNFVVKKIRNKIFISYGPPMVVPKKFNTCGVFYMKIDQGRKYIVVDSLKYPNQINCLLSGSQILYRLYKATQGFNTEMGEQYNMMVTEDASIKYFNKTACFFPLPEYSILLTGESWYNKMGFFASGHWDNYENNQTILHTTLHDLFIIDGEKDNEKNNEKNNKIMTEVLEWIAANTDSPVNQETEVQDIMKTIEAFIQKHKQDEKAICASGVVAIINHIIKAAKDSPDGLEYENEDLILDIHNEDIQKLYETLGKKIGEATITNENAETIWKMAK